MGPTVGRRAAGSVWACRRQARRRGPDPPLTLPTAGPSLHPEPGAGTLGDLVSKPQLNILNSRPSTGGREKPECGSQPGLAKSEDNLSGRGVSRAGRGTGEPWVCRPPALGAHLSQGPPRWVPRSRHTGERVVLGPHILPPRSCYHRALLGVGLLGS